MMHVEEHLVAELADRDHRRGGDCHAIADARDFDEHFIGAAIDETSAQRADHRPATIRSRGAWARWHNASATASAASTGRNGVSVPRSIWTMRSISSFPAPPQPATACFTSLGPYCATWQPALMASAIASPLAWPTD